MVSIAFPWLDGGRSITLNPVPMAGSRELQEVQMRGAAAEAARRNVSVVAMMSYVLGAARIREAKGSKEACAAWNREMQRQGVESFIWGEADFDANLDAWLKDTVHKQLETSTLDEASNALKDAAERANKAFSEHEQAILDNNHDSALVELYWRLHASDAQAITPADEEPIPFRRAKGERQAMRDALAEHASLEDLATIRLAFAKAKREKPIDASAFDFVTEEVVLGKSETATATSTPSSGALPPSSAPITVSGRK